MWLQQSICLRIPYVKVMELKITSRWLKTNTCGHKYFCVTNYTHFGLKMIMFDIGFKAWVAHLALCYVFSVHWIPQIYLLLLGSQHGSWVILYSWICKVLMARNSWLIVLQHNAPFNPFQIGWKCLTTKGD